MNLPAAISLRETVKLTVTDFLLLRGFGAFETYWKAELIDGELWGVPGDGDEEPESDAVYPIELTINHYELLDRAGALLAHRKTELIDGRIYVMSPQHRPHGYVKDEFAYRIRRILEASASPLHASTERSLALAPFSEPQPDITLTDAPVGSGAIPGMSAALIVEVSDSTSAFDRKQKAAIYASADIAEYWAVDVNKRMVRQMWEPHNGVYRQVLDDSFGELVTAKTIEGLVVDTTNVAGDEPS